MQIIIDRLKKYIPNILGLSSAKPFSSVELHPETALAIAELASDAAPKEFFAYMGGKVIGNVLKLDGLYYQTYYASKDFALVFSNLPMIHNCLATVHSHPGSRGKPSRADYQFFSRKGLVHIIISKPYSIDNISCFFGNGKPCKFSIKQK